MQASPDRISRNVYTLLSQARPLTASPEPAATVRVDDNDEVEEDNKSTSWCGALERGILKASTRSDSTTQKRKRRRKEDAEVQISF